MATFDYDDSMEGPSTLHDDPQTIGYDDPQSEPLDIPDDALADDDEPIQGATVISDTKKAREKKKFAYDPKREPGKTHAPLSKVRQITKADRELPVVQKEALFVLAIAAEEFVRRMAGAAERIAKRDQRTTQQMRDLATLVRREGEYMFLDDLILMPPLEETVGHKGKTKQPKEKIVDSARGPLDRFVAKDPRDEEDLAAQIIVNEDGTMSMEL